MGKTGAIVHAFHVAGKAHVGVHSWCRLWRKDWLPPEAMRYHGFTLRFAAGDKVGGSTHAGIVFIA